MPRVSVIIPTFNRSQFLFHAISSVLVQTYSGFEILVIDDGSIDDTSEVVAGFNDPRIRYIKQENCGRSTARNLGLEQAQGEYIAFLDDDDLYLPHKLAIQISYLDSHQEVGLVGGGANIIDEDGILLRVRESWKEQPQLSLPSCLYACPLLTCSVLLRRLWLDRLDHWFDPAIDRAEDTDFWIRLLLAGCRMDWTTEIVCAYRWHPDNSQKDAQHYLHGYLLMLDKLFARSDLPLEIRQEQPSLYTHYYVLAACHAYAANQIELGQTRLNQAVNIDHSTSRGNPPAIARSIAEIAQSDALANPSILIDTIFEYLPPELEVLQPYRRYALSTLHMRRVFKAHSDQERFSFKDWLLGVYYYPRWLTNRGVWSILMHDLVLSFILAG
ncbi:MAG: glycosyltransferase family 2 protein [Anaerolineales bacterium]